MKRISSLLALCCLAGCDGFPRDLSGTLERARSDGVVRVGFIASAAPSAETQRLRELVRRTAAAAAARPLVTEEAAEPLLLMLEEGEIDLVVGEFDSASPWVRRVHLIPPLATQQRGGSKVEATAALRNGENAWIMLVEREARALAAQ